MNRENFEDALLQALASLRRIEESTDRCARELRNLRASSLGPTAHEERQTSRGQARRTEVTGASTPEQLELLKKMIA